MIYCAAVGEDIRRTPQEDKFAQRNTNRQMKCPKTLVNKAFGHFCKERKL